MDINTIYEPIFEIGFYTFEPFISWIREDIHTGIFEKKYLMKSIKDRLIHLIKIHDRNNSILEKKYALSKWFLMMVSKKIMRKEIQATKKYKNRKAQSYYIIWIRKIPELSEIGIVLYEEICDKKVSYYSE
jgi:hypothetical protein